MKLLIKISNSAQIYLYKLLAKQKIGTKIRIFIKNPGTSIAKCNISYCHISRIKDDDMKIKYEKIIIYIDNNSIPYLKNAKINLIEKEFNSFLVLNVPNAKNNSITTNNFSLFEKVKYSIKNHINPKLSMHGGRIKLIKITSKKYALIKFSGSCNGCKMSNLTLKKNVEKILLKKFPELNKILDITTHIHGIHSYY